MGVLRKPGELFLAVVLVAVGLTAPKPAVAQAPPPDLTYLEMSDGVQIAISVAYPSGFDPAEPRWPALFQMDGYGGGASPGNPGSYGHQYVMVKASIRGTGCSGGRFDLFDRRHAEDGKEIIDGWIASQPWFDPSKGVGIIGHSYAGLTGFLVATTQPEHLKAVAVSGLIEDLYRGLVYMGGISNLGFPAIWTLGYRPASELLGNVERYLGETGSGDPTCVANIATRTPLDPIEHPLVSGATQLEDGPWWRLRSLSTWADRINRPIHIISQYQDEQTGPSGGLLWSSLPEEIPKRMVLTNGVHATAVIARDDRVAWLDCHLRDDCRGDIADPARRVRLHFETTGSTGVDEGGASANGAIASSDYPFPETEWTRMYLRGSGALSPNRPTVDDARRVYVSAPLGRQAYAFPLADPIRQVDEQLTGPILTSSGPDHLTYAMSFAEPTAIAGPVATTLWMSSSSVDTDVFVQLIDEAPDGSRQYLQRGLLRASHRSVDELRSKRIETGPHAGEIYRPHRSHTNTLLDVMVPGQPTELLVEVFPIGHVFRAGHKLVVKVEAPPAVDSLYVNVSARPSVNMIHHGPEHLSSILLPILPSLPPISEQAPDCGAQIGVRCVRPLF